MVRWTLGVVSISCYECVDGVWPLLKALTGDDLVFLPSIGKANLAFLHSFAKL